MNAKEPKFNASGSIDLILEHPTFGWIPFTAAENDSTQLGREMYGKAINGDFGAVAIYVAPTPTPEQQREEAKAARAIAVGNIKVTTAAGNTFDGDETSQTRMSRAILVLSTGAAASVPWVLADNTVIQADIAELTEALALAGAAQARLWVL